MTISETFCLDDLHIPGQTHHLTDRQGRSVICDNEGSVTTVPAHVFSQLRVEIVELVGGVGFRNADGKYLAANTDWGEKSSSLEQVFTAESHGDYQAFKSHIGEYLSIKDDGSLEMLMTSIVDDAQLFMRQRG